MSQKRKASIGFIFVTLLIDVIGFGIIIPVLPKLISQINDCSISEAAKYGGWLMFAYSIMQFLFAPLLGNLSDKFGRRPILLLSLFGFGIDYLFLAFANTLPLFFLGRLIAGIMGASFTTGSAYIADISTPDKRAQNFGMIGAAFGLGFIIGPVIGGLLGQYGTRVPFIAAAIFSLLNCLYGYFLLPESLDAEHRREFDWKRCNPFTALLNLKRYPMVFGLVGSLACLYIAAHSVQSCWSYFTIEVFDWTERMIGISLGVVGVLVAFVQGYLIRILNPWLGQKRSVYYGIGFYALGMLLFAFANQSWMMFAFLIPYCLGGIAMPALQGIISGQVPANEQGDLQGALTSLMSATAIIGPPLMTNLFSFYTGPKASFYFPGAAFLTGAILTIISVFLAMRSMKGYENKKG